MKFKIILVVLFFQNIYSQINNGEVTYKVTFPIDEQIEKIEKFKKKFNEIREGTLLLTMKLYFTKDESNFTVMEYSGLDNKKWLFAKSVALANYPIYSNRIDKTVLFTTFQKNSPLFKDNEFLVQYNFDDWELIDEQKTIDNFICNKAISKKEKIVNGRKIVYTNIAWYCPQIPVSFGPKGYGGLPGLILELNENNKIIYHASAFDLNKLSEKITKPNKGETISLEKYNELYNERNAKLMMQRE
ncbi:GLPGLI family protein [Flavobacterium lacus]|nr:GLPGLI family protein [Flavobacterium lacus]